MVVLKNQIADRENILKVQKDKWRDSMIVKNSSVLEFLCELIQLEKENRKHKSAKRKAKTKWQFEKDNMSLKSELNGKDYMFTGCGYLLNQTIRQYIPSDENYYISKKAYELWKELSDDSIWGYVYTNKIEFKGKTKKTIDKYTGNGKKTTPITLIPGKTFEFNDIFSDEHMIDVASVIEILLRLKNPTPQSVKAVLDQIHIARILKSEDKELTPNHNRLKAVDYKSMDMQYILNTVYKNVELIPKSKTK